MAAAPIIFAAISAVASGAVAAKALTTKSPKAPDLPTLPDKPADTGPAKSAVAQRRNRTLLFADQGSTKPSTLLAGALPPAPVVRSTLLGM